MDSTLRREAGPALGGWASELDVLADAVLATDETGRIQYANPAAARLLGRPLADLVGRPLTDVMPERFHAAHLAGFHRFMSTGRSTILGRPIRVPVLHSDGSELPIELTLSRVPGPTARVIGVLRDLRERVELERKVSAQRKILAQYAAVSVLADATSAAEALPQILQATAEALQWDVAIYWALDRASGRLARASTWSSGTADARAFIEGCGELTFGPGEALPGLALASEDAVWSNDVRSDPRATRSSLAAVHGFRSALLFPVYCSHRTWGVLEFLSRWDEGLDEELRQTMKALGFQIGQFLERLEKEAELGRALAQAQADRLNLATLFEEAPAAIAIVRGPEMRYELSNATNQMLAADRPLVGRTVSEALPELEAAGVVAMVTRVYETGQPFLAHEYPLTLPAAPGRPERPIFMNGVAQPLHGPGGAIEGVMIFAYDVTDLVTARDRVQEAEERLRLAVEAAEVGTWDYDPRTGAIRTDARYRRLFGLDAGAEITADTITGAIHPEDRARVDDVVQRSFDPRTGGEYSVEYRTIGVTDGVERWVAMRGRMLFDERNQPLRFVGTGVDVTKERRALDRLRFLAEASTTLASGLDYRVTLNALARQVTARLADWCVVDVATGADEVEMVAVAHADPAHEELARELRRRYPPEQSSGHGIARVMASGQPVLVPTITDEALARFARDQGQLAAWRRLRPRSVMLLPLQGRDRPLGVLTLVQAQSGRRFGPDDLAFAGEIARRAAVAVDNAMLFDRATRAIGVRDQFLSIASHELRTPLTSLLLQLSGLKRLAEAGRLGELTGDVLARRIGLMDAQATRLSALVDDLLDVSRMTAGRVAIDRRPVDLAALIDDVVKRLQPEARRAGMQIVVDAPGPGAVVGDWDARRLDQVFTNIVANAVKYAPGKPVAVRVSRTADAAVVTVSDRGPGIAEADRARIFGQFERAAPASLAGLGLGLWIASRIIQAHGGRIELASPPGGGASFTVSLPFGSEP